MLYIGSVLQSFVEAVLAYLIRMKLHLRSNWNLDYVSVNFPEELPVNTTSKKSSSKCTLKLVSEFQDGISSF